MAPDCAPDADTAHCRAPLAARPPSRARQAGGPELSAVRRRRSERGALLLPAGDVPRRWVPISAWERGLQAPHSSRPSLPGHHRGDPRGDPSDAARRPHGGIGYGEARLAWRSAPRGSTGRACSHSTGPGGSTSDRSSCGRGSSASPTRIPPHCFAASFTPTAAGSSTASTVGSTRVTCSTTFPTTSALSSAAPATSTASRGGGRRAGRSRSPAGAPVAKLDRVVGPKS
jgi:hypothetical protein